MNKITVICIVMLAFTVSSISQGKKADDITVACYYFPNYHTRDTTDLRISRQHFENWSEWELVKAATPRFEGHDQPKVPLWGYADEKDPKVIYPYTNTNTLANNTPENFKTALQMTQEKLPADSDGPRIMNINCWNEWTEASYLEPDVKNGMKYLEAVRDVFK